MAERVLQHITTIPAGTTAADPTVDELGFDNWDVERIDLQVPPGPLGCMGFYLANNGMPWIPRALGEWIVWDDHRETFYPTGYPTGAGWQLVGYNTGTFPHVVICRFHVNPVAVGEPAGVELPRITFIEHGVAENAVVL